MHAVAKRAGSLVLTAMLIAGPFSACMVPRVAPRALGRTSSAAAATYLAEFDSLWSRFDKQYPSFAYKGVDWAAQRALYRGRAARARSQAEFIAVAREMMAPLHDRHIWFTDPRGQAVPTFGSEHVANFDASRWQHALRDAGYVQRGKNLGEGNVGGYAYLFIDSWNGSVDAPALDLAMARVRESPGLIIDLRMNGGGSDATALNFASRFTSRAFVASFVQVRTGPKHTDLDVPNARMVSPRGPWQYLRPVVVLTGRAGLSATETFVAAMRTLPNVTVIGDTTGGASGSPATFALANGWSHTVPQWMEFGPDHAPIEGRGIAPHVPLPWLPSSYERERDPLIDAAVGLLGELNGVFRVTGGQHDASAPARGAGERLPPRQRR